MTAQHQFDPRYDPPAPVLALRVSPPTGTPAVSLSALVDTGADVSVIPEAVARSLGLPMIAQIRIRGVGGGVQLAPIYAAKIECNGFTRFCEVVGVGDEALLGRNLLNEWTLLFDGPRQLLELH